MNRFVALFGVWMGALVGGWFVNSTVQAECTAEKCEHGVVVRIDGQPFCEYWTKSGNKPIVWPILAPDGTPVTRSYPMKEVAGEKADHIHHRSLWFTHGEVNGIDFWAEVNKKAPVGVTVHREFVKVAGGPTATIVTRNDWLAPDGKRQLEDERRLQFGKYDAGRFIDFDITLRASDGPVVFGDTKEGSFGMRVAETMRVDAKKGGQIVNSDGKTDAAAWGQQASWVDYHGPVEGKTLGIAILNHPSSFHYPTHWHVRTYGLYAVNPFGDMSFRGEKNPPHGPGFTLAKGQSLVICYRVLIHAGDEKAGKVAEAFTAYAKAVKPK